jgi:hypothetical protein
MATETTNRFVLCLKGNSVFAGFLAAKTVNNQGTFTVTLREAFDFTGHKVYRDVTYLAIHGPTGLVLEGDSLPAIALSEVETILVCREKAHDEYTRAVGL